MYRSVIRPILFALHIERAHRTVVWLLRLAGWLPGGLWLLSRCFAVRHPALGREVFGLHFDNPVGLAAGVDRSGEAIAGWGAAGFGFVEVGTLTPRPQPGNPRPRIYRLPKDDAMIHRTGLPNRGLEVAIRHLRRPRKGMVVGCNIGRNTSTLPENGPSDYLKLFRNLYQYADYFTVHICCDNPVEQEPSLEEVRKEILRILDPLFDFRRGQNQYRPIMLKVSPDMSDETVDVVTDILIETPLDGIVATDGTLGRDGLKTSRAAVGKAGSGRLSGAPLTRRAVEIVRRIHTRSGGNYPIIGVGGVMSADDARAMFAAGADLVQVCTGLVYEGPRLVRDICRALIADAEAAANTAAPEVAENTTAAETPDTPASEN
ncbi:quinone-dependent dihydroorotate dehydrogenase [uncultured Alistipes sp.]|uniref:quinone-dependent dihydroorotate dehydrogenase n=1 Tax=uncultured Alistipes sp. TaxID=538949 RepID=UPI00259398F8|nr:quinone-dependent dihydroorotate dehydrogenase [uncultured Alistipes sp.]